LRIKGNLTSVDRNYRIKNYSPHPVQCDKGARKRKKKRKRRKRK